MAKMIWLNSAGCELGTYKLFPGNTVAQEIVRIIEHEGLEIEAGDKIIIDEE